VCPESFDFKRVSVVLTLDKNEWEGGGVWLASPGAARFEIS